MIDTMSKEHTVIEISEHEVDDSIKILIQSFYESPQIPILIKKPQHTKTIILHLIQLYKETGTIKLFGIKKEERLVCIGLCIDSDAHPSRFQMILFGWMLIRTVGLKGVSQVWIYYKKKPTYEKRCLELILYGTVKGYQQHGYGRAMLNFLYEYARQHQYGGVTGVTNTSRPAFQFYMRDGWVVDKEFIIGKYRICWVRKKV